MSQDYGPDLLNDPIKVVLGVESSARDHFHNDQIDQEQHKLVPGLRQVFLAVK